MLCSAGVDLNRDFPDPLLLGTTGLQPTGNEQPETLALMQWMSGTHFVASVSLHEVPQQLILNSGTQAEPRLFRIRYLHHQIC